jgi:hypothetical protein
LNNFFFKNPAACDIMWENTVERDTPQMAIWRMGVACRKLKTTNTHSQYVNFLLLHCNNGCTNAPQCYVIRTLPRLLLTNPSRKDSSTLSQEMQPNSFPPDADVSPLLERFEATLTVRIAAPQVMVPVSRPICRRHQHNFQRSMYVCFGVSCSCQLDSTASIPHNIRVKEYSTKIMAWAPSHRLFYNSVFLPYILVL